METLNLKQGSPEWKEARMKHFTASEAPAMMNASKYMSRDDLLKLKKTGVEKEHSDFTLKLFEKGHATEALARPIIEEIIGDELYPVTGRLIVEGLPLLASFDGLTMMFDTGFEHKLWNEGLAEKLKSMTIDPMYYWQLEQQLLISNAEKIVFVTSDGTKEKMESFEYYPVPGRAEQLIAGWQQFASDLAVYEAPVDVVKPEATAIMDLPAINIEIKGEVALSNLPDYEKAVTAFIENINTDLVTDQDFADAEKTVKFCGEAEKKLELVKEQALEQTADISQLFRTINKLKEEMRVKRLNLDKSVKTQKEKIKNEIIMAAEKEYTDHETALNNSLGGLFISLNPNIAFAVKGKKTVSSLRSAANDQVAQMKIETNAIADNARANQKLIPDEYKFLFSDIAQIIHKPNDDFKLLVDSRINEHKQAEEERLEAERKRIREEEEQKARDSVKTVETTPEAPEKQDTVTPQSSDIKDDAKPASKKERDAHTDLVEAEVTASLLDNGFGAQTAKKMTKLLATNSIKHVTINY